MLKRTSLIQQISRRLHKGFAPHGEDDTPQPDSINEQERLFQEQPDRANILLCTAPTGYGKSVTAKQVQTHCEENHTIKNFHWFIIENDVTENKQLTDIAEEIAKITKAEGENNGRNKLSKVLIIDNIHRISPDIDSIPFLEFLADISIKMDSAAILLLGRYFPFSTEQNNTSINNFISQLKKNALSINDFKFSEEEQQQFFYTRDEANPETLNGQLNAVGFGKDEYQEISKAIALADGWPAILDLIRHYSTLKQPDLIFQSTAYYFETLISTNLSELEQRFLYNSAILPLFDSALYKSIFDSDANQSLIESLEKKFHISRIEKNNITFWRLSNALLKDYLAKSHREENSQEIQNALSSAIDYYQEKGLLFEAVELAMSIRSYARALSIIDENRNFFDAPSSWHVIAEWFKEIPAQILENHAGLTDLLAWEYIRSLVQATKPQKGKRIPRSDTFSFITNKTNNPPPTIPIDLRSKLRPITEGNLNIFIDGVDSIEQATASITTIISKQNSSDMLKVRQLRKRLNKDTPKPLAPPEKQIENKESKSVWQLFQSFTLAINELNFSNAIDDLTLLINASIKNNKINSAFNCLILLGLVSHCHGDNEKLFNSIKQIKDWVDENQFTNHPLSHWIEGAKFLYLLESNETEKCESILNQLKNSVVNTADPALTFVMHYYSAYLSISLNDTTNARVHLEAVGLIPLNFSKSMFDIIAPTEILQLVIILQEKQLDRAQQVLKIPSQSIDTSSTNTTITDPFSHLTNLFIRRITDNDSSTDKLLCFITRQATKKKFHLLAFHAQLLTAIIHFRDNRNKPAINAFKEAGKISKKHNFIRTLLNYSVYTHYLFMVCNENDPELIETADYLSEPYAISMKEPSYEKVNPLLIKLSKREREILKLIAEGKSNEEIASMLCRSIGTIKLHLHNIFQKLGVKKRFQAKSSFHKFGID